MNLTKLQNNFLLIEMKMYLPTLIKSKMPNQAEKIGVC